MGKAKGSTRRYGAGFKWQQTDKKQHRAFKKRYLTLSQAAERLMVDRHLLRRIVVFKGFYPVKPKTYEHSSGKDKTYYPAPELMSLEKDPLLAQLRAYEVWRRKMTRYIAKEQLLKAKILKQQKPVINFVPIVKERFPMFADALKALDDALSHVALFSILPPASAASTNIEAHKFLTMRQHQQCQELIDKWNNFVIRSHALRKVFFTIKGIYFQAEVSGETITWLCPYEFTTTLPKTVDYGVMIAFLEYYLVHLGFVVFKLHHDVQKQERDEESKPEVTDTATEDFPRTPEEQAKRDELVRCRTLFDKLTFYLQRETPVKHLALMVQAFGGMLAASADDPSITHVVVDRPKETVDMSNKSRDYIQPQWVADCCNAGRLLPVDNYAPGATLPPHLSPFPAARWGNDYDPNNPYAADEEDDKKVPQLSDSEDEAEKRAQETPSEDDESVLTDNDYGDKEDDGEGGAASGKPGAGEAEEGDGGKSKKKRQQQKGFSEMGLRMQMMHKRDKHLYKAIKGREIQQKEKVKHYSNRRRKIEQGELQVHPSGKMLVKAAAGEKGAAAAATGGARAAKRPRPNPQKKSSN